MNYCQSFCWTIQKMCNIGDGDSPFNLQSVWADIVDTTAINANKTYTDSDSIAGGITTTAGASGYITGTVLAPDGFIYVFPTGGNKIYKIDTNTDTISLVAEIDGVTDANYYTGVYAPDGCIYSISYTNKHILKFNPSTDTYTTFGNSELTDINKSFGGACMLPNGNIVCSPQSSNYVLIINIYTQNITSQSLSPVSGGPWNYMYLAPNGYFYCVNYGDGAALKIECQTLAATKLARWISTNSYPAIASDEKIYGINASSNYGPLCILDTTNDTIDRNSPTYGSGYIKWEVLAPNGKIYCSPGWSGDRGKVTVFDPQNKTYATLNQVTGKYSYGSGKLAPNGMIYFVPNITGNNLAVIKVNPGADVCQNFKESTLLSPYLNKF